MSQPKGETNGCPKYDWGQIVLLNEIIGRGGSCRVELGRIQSNSHLRHEHSRCDDNSSPASHAVADGNSIVQPINHDLSRRMMQSNESGHTQLLDLSEYVALKIVEQQVDTPSSLVAASPSPNLSSTVDYATATRRLLIEQDILQQLSHPGVPKLLGTIITSSQFVSILPFYPYGSLAHHLRHHARRLMPIQNVRQYMSELIYILSHLHSNGIIHRDISAKNILVDRNGHLVLADFGMAKRIHISHRSREADKSDAPSDSTHSSSVYVPFPIMSDCTGGDPTPSDEGTVHYLAPERLTCVGDGPAADWWAIGVILHEMLYGSLPFDGGAIDDVRRSITTYNNEPSDRPYPPRHTMNSDALDLLSLLMEVDPNKRLANVGLNGTRIKQHEFFPSPRDNSNPPSSFASSPEWDQLTPIEFVKHIGPIDVEELINRSETHC